MNLFIDLETIPSQAEGALEDASALVKVPANYKKPEAIEKYRQTHAEEAYRKTALQGIAGEICSIAWAFDSKDICVCTRDETTSEGDLLQCFFYDLRFDDGRGEFQRITWIGHNLINFDLRFLKQRSLVNRIRCPVHIPADARHGSNNVFDTMKEWAGWRGYVKQDTLYAALGGPPFENDTMDGSQVWDLWKDGKFDELSEYNKRDVEKLRFIYNAMVWT